MVSQEIYSEKPIVDNLTQKVEFFKRKDHVLPCDVKEHLKWPKSVAQAVELTIVAGLRYCLIGRMDFSVKFLV